MKNKKLRIKKMVSVLLAFCFTICVAYTESKAEESTLEDVSAKSAILITADTKEIIFDKQADEQMSMASTTKIMTALLGLEKCAEEDNPVVEITEEMVLVEGSSMGLRAGDKLPLYDIICGMMLSSGNDAANSVALYISENAEEFANLMNERAAEIGMASTNFVTASGLDDDEHYTTAYDMALLAAEAMENEDFRNIVASETIIVNFQEPEKSVTYTNHNKLLWQYEDCIGIKTGFTKKSGRCLVSAAKRDGVTLIAVTLNAPDDWNDHAAMFEYGFSVTEKVTLDATKIEGTLPVVGSDIEKIIVRGESAHEITTIGGNIESIIRLPKFIYAEVKQGETIGRIDYYIDGEKIYSIPIIAAESAGYIVKEKGFFDKLFNR